VRYFHRHARTIGWDKWHTPPSGCPQLLHHGSLPSDMAQVAYSTVGMPSSRDATVALFRATDLNLRLAAARRYRSRLVRPSVLIRHSCRLSRTLRNLCGKRTRQWPLCRESIYIPYTKKYSRGKWPKFEIDIGLQVGRRHSRRQLARR
jgi:hypothetical protein